MRSVDKKGQNTCEIIEGLNFVCCFGRVAEWNNDVSQDLIEQVSGAFLRRGS